MKTSDRIIGYISLLALLGLFAGIAYGMFDAHEHITYKAYVDFTELGSLQPEDPVVIRGYTVGTIGKVTWMGDRARVEVKFDEPIVLREGTQFNDVNYAIMGQRRLEIIPNKNGKVLPPDYIHQGNFEPGIAEALRYMEDVNAQITNVREVVMLITEGDSTHRSAKEVYEDVMQTIEGILESADKTIDKLNPAVNTLIRQLNDAGNTVADMTNQVDTTVKVTTDALNEKIAQAEGVIKSVSEGTKKAEQIIADIENSPAMDKLVNSREIVDKVADLTKKMNDLIAAIDTKGIKMYDENGKEVKLFTWKNTNLIGKTAREKAKIRAEKGEALPGSEEVEGE
ncbi:MAG: MCE family protein [Fibrobacter sp.]|jgi:ABC-type transporter Mla subunit MlaD|nr:MCE family protein [Fibrobacter sp.]